METAQDLLSVHPFLAGLTAAQVERLSYWSRRQAFRAGARLFEEGGYADRFWLIRDGRVALDLHGPQGTVVVETLGAGAVLGWSWLFPPYRWHFGATAGEQTLAVELNGPAVRGLCAQEPALGYELMNRFLAVVVDRMQATRLRLLDLYRSPG
ncbi:MAG TPA: cyclic nucleotide-binding domain-containing protein [Rugosimonospora sp.]|nr:cyclic nucleotide-binding domain-containing protein [Rugosimonospora sp.]